MNAATLDADEYAQIGDEPVGVASAAIAASIVALEHLHLANHALD